MIANLPWPPYNVGRMIRVGSIVLRVDDLQRQTEFWEAALDYVRRESDSDDFVLLRPRDGIGPNISLDQVRSTPQIPPRIHLDLYTDDQAGEVERLLILGATEVHWDKRPPDADYVILADPEGKPLLRRGHQLDHGQNLQAQLSAASAMARVTLSAPSV
jgi:catechol 2,3-dioxygenase-like lactoylglutathione lyase family enzyme